MSLQLTELQRHLAIYCLVGGTVGVVYFLLFIFLSNMDYELWLCSVFAYITTVPIAYRGTCKILLQSKIFLLY